MYHTKSQKTGALTACVDRRFYIQGNCQFFYFRRLTQSALADCQQTLFHCCFYEYPSQGCAQVVCHSDLVREGKLHQTSGSSRPNFYGPSCLVMSTNNIYNFWKVQTTPSQEESLKRRGTPKTTTSFKPQGRTSKLQPQPLILNPLYTEVYSRSGIPRLLEPRGLQDQKRSRPTLKRLQT